MPRGTTLIGVVRLTLTLLLVLWTLSPGIVSAADDGEEVPGSLPWRADAETVFLRRVVEAATGKPVEGATVKLFCEVPHPEPGFGTPVARTTSGPDGWVRIRKKDIDPKITATFGPPTWAYVDAPGLRPDALFQGTEKPRRNGKETEQPGDFMPVDPDWQLGPATTLRVALRDPLDRPVAGALLSWLLGCGHTPDVRQARTSRDGVAVLQGVGAAPGFGQIWPVAEGLRSPNSYVTDDAYAPWERPRIATLTWATTVTGTVLTHDGKPAAGVAVGVPDCHRGPWTHTDTEGNFSLVGSEVEPGHAVHVELGDYVVGPASAPKTGLVTALTFPAPLPGHRAVVRLPEPGKQPEEEADNVRLVVEVDRTDWPESKARPSIEVYAVRTTDGWTTMASVGEQEVALLDVRPGSYVVEALGMSQAGGVVYSRARIEVVAPAKGGAYARAEMPAPAVQPLEIEWPDHSPFFEDVAILVDGATSMIPHESDGRHVEILLPPDRDVFLRVSQGGRKRLVPFDRKTLRPGARAPEVIVHALAPLEIRARFVDGQGKPATGWLFESTYADPIDTEDQPKGDPSAMPSSTVTSGDQVRLVAWPQDDAQFQPSIVEVAAPAPGKLLDLGPIRLAPRSPALTLEDAEGKPYESATVRVTHGDRAEELSSGKGAWTGRVVDPWDVPGLLVEGAIVRVLGGERIGGEGGAAYDVPFVRVLAGTGPWSIRAPRGSLTIDARGDGEEPLGSWTVRLDGHPYVAKGLRLRLGTVDAGPHDAVVEADGRTPRRLTFTLAEGEQRSWTPHLQSASGR